MIDLRITTPRAATLRDIVVGGTQVLGTVAGAPVLRHRYLRWGATDRDVEAPLPGDEFVPEPQLTSTRAIEVAAPPERVWPWLMQLGWQRGGLYSFDGLENLVGCDLHSADSLLEDVAPLEIGDLLRSGPPGYPAWEVVRIAEPHHLVLLAVDPDEPSPRPVGELASDRVRDISSWQWVLEPRAQGHRTRLITRTRTSYRRRSALLWHLVEPISFVMERRMLLGIRARVEAAEAPEGARP